MSEGILYYSKDWREASEASSLKKGEKRLSPFFHADWAGQPFLKNYYLSITDRRLIMGEAGFLNSAVWVYEHVVDPIWELPFSGIQDIQIRDRNVEITTRAGEVISLHLWKEQPVNVLKQVAMKVSAEKEGASFEIDSNVKKPGYALLQWFRSRF